jgi:hypothetical protein
VGNRKHQQNLLREMEFPLEEGWKVEVQVIGNQLQLLHQARKHD